MGEKINNDILLIYVYDEAGSVIGLKYREAIYSGDLYDCFYFEKNLQGDIVAIYNESGTKIGGYKYDAWGKPTVVLESTATTLERQIVQTYNPFRYRGYYYDTETGLYYLQSRYYNPEWGRFLNADGIGYLGANGDLVSYNLFAYCSNNPVMHTDPSGHSLLMIALIIFVPAIAGGVIGGVVAHNNGAEGIDVVKSIFTGVAMGLAVGGAIVSVTAVAVGAVLGAQATVLGGVSVLRAFALGALAYDVAAFGIAPVLTIPMEGIEYEAASPSSIVPVVQPTVPHPAMYK